jgi:hypothetical protein
MRRLLVSHVSRHPEEGDQDSKNNPNVDAHGQNLCRIGALLSREWASRQSRFTTTATSPVLIAQ